MRSMDDDVEVSPQGLLRCLEVLSEEAACLTLPRTFAALREAIETCRDEAEAAIGDATRQAAAGLIH